MGDIFHLSAKKRTEDQQGKGASRRLRNQNLVPAIIYGGAGEPVAITLNADQFRKDLSHESFFSHILTIDVEGNEEQVIIKALQRHPAKNFAMHADFQRIVKGQLMNFNVPVHFEGGEESPGAKAGGVISTTVTDIEISCLPKDLPEYLIVDISHMEIGDSLRLSDMKLPEGVKLPALELEEGTDRVIVNMQAPRLEVEEDDEAPEADDVPAINQDDEAGEDAAKDDE